MLEIKYFDNKVFDQGIFLVSIEINVIQLKGRIDINLNYNIILFNEEFFFLYSVLSGYKKIIIK